MMDWESFVLGAVLALIGGCLGASVSGLGGFLLFGLSGVLGLLYLLFVNNDAWMEVATVGVVFRPDVCFLGGVVATAYTRKNGLIECGKDIGRSLLSFHRFDILLVGSLAGLGGYLLTFGLNKLLAGKIDTIAISVFLIPLVIKYIWRMTKTNDCEAASHAVPSPYRFFEKLSTPVGKTILSLLIGIITAIIAWLLTLNSNSAPYAGMIIFFISALSLYFIFMGIPIPATHHLSGPAGAAVVCWLTLNNGAANSLDWITFVLWGVTAALLGMVAGDLMGKFFFKEGDIHVDPPAMGIVVATGIVLGILPLTGIYSTSFFIQSVLCIIIIALCIIFSLTILRQKQ